VDHSHLPALPAVTAHKNPSRFENSPHLSEEPILQFGRGHMVQHGEGNDTGELFIGEGHFRGIADYDMHIAATQSPAQRHG
jgi:hypothetical protein